MDMQRVYCVSLRMPSNRKDKRPDPKYEIGNFGSTGCHSNNLLSDTGFREKRIRKGDRLVFVQSNKVVFITPPIRRLDRVDKYNVTVWNPNWGSKASRPLKLRHSMKLDLSHARMINPNIMDLKKIGSHLRAYTKPIGNPHKFISDYEAFVKKQEAEYGDAIYVEHYCQTFCEDRARAIKKNGGRAENAETDTVRGTSSLGGLETWT